MLLAKRAIFSPKSEEVFHFLLKKNHCQAFSSITCKVISKRSNGDLIQKNSFQEQLRKELHVTIINRDLEAGLKGLGAGVATSAMIGPGIGIGIVFGNFLTAISRNPSLSNKLIGNAIMGAAFCESLGLFALTLAFVIMD